MPRTVADVDRELQAMRTKLAADRRIGLLLSEQIDLRRIDELLDERLTRGPQ